MHEMTTLDNQTFASSDGPWSGAAGYEPKIRPNGILTGGIVTPAAGNTTVAVSLATCYLNGELVTVTGNAGLDLVGGAPTRPTEANVKILSIIVTDAGVLSVVEGTQGAAFVAARGEAGGPPWIDYDAIEVAQVRLSGSTAAPVAAGDIYAVPGVHREMADMPTYTEDYAEGTIRFISALPLIHKEGDDPAAPKKVYCEIFTPSFAGLEPAGDFVPPETTHSQSSTAVYGGAIGAASSSLAQGSFTVYLRDGITDPIIALKNQKLWIKFLPHRLRAAHLLCQGILGVGRSYPAGDSIKADCTLTADGPAVETAE